MKLLRTVTLLGATVVGGFAQHPAGNFLIVETANHTLYAHDATDYSILATKAGPTTAMLPKNFGQYTIIGDIVSVNGQPAKGTVFEMVNALAMAPNPQPGQAIADITRGGLIEWYFEVLDSNANLIGSMRVSGVNGGPPPPGQTRQIQQASYVVVGGTGAFLGVRGYMGAPAPGGSCGAAMLRSASISEDPANRRMYPGGCIRQGIYLLPMTTPEIVTTEGRPAIVHAGDYSLVTAAKPAKAGEDLVLFASGLGPTRPAPEPGQPFSADPLSVANSPIEVIVNGASAEVQYAGGYPGAVDRYQVNFRVPDRVASGLPSLHLTTAWIAGGDVKIPIQ
jgi:hypothetical protein